MSSTIQDCSTNLVTSTLDGQRLGDIPTTRVDRKAVLLTGPASFTIANNAGDGATVGTLTFDANASNAFSVLAGNSLSVFALHPTTGALTILSNVSLGVAGTIHRLTVKLAVTGGSDQTEVVVTVT